MTNEEIIITPEHWKQPHDMSYNVKKPDGTCWNVSAVNDGLASIWTVNAWGSVHHEAIAVSELKPVNIRPMFAMWKCASCGNTNYFRKQPCLCGQNEPA